jgi:hypothetical protein
VFGVGLFVAAGALTVWAFATSGPTSAQEPPPDGPIAHYRMNLAEQLGVTPEQLRTMEREAYEQTVADALARGAITQEQADRLLSMDREDLRAHARSHAGKVKAAIRGVFQAAAETIGISGDELKSKLQAGKSLAQVASDHNVSRDALKLGITSSVESDLENAVSEGRITQEQADRMLSGLTSRLDDVIDRTHDGTPPVRPGMHFRSRP